MIIKTVETGKLTRNSQKVTQTMTGIPLGKS